MSDRVMLAGILWWAWLLAGGGFASMALDEWPALAHKTREQRATFAVAAILCAPLVLAAGVLYGLWRVARTVALGARQWAAEFRGRPAAPVEDDAAREAREELDRYLEHGDERPTARPTNGAPRLPKSRRRNAVGPAATLHPM